MIWIYAAIALCGSVIATMVLLELVTWWFDDRRRFKPRRLKKKAANCKRKRP